MFINTNQVNLAFIMTPLMEILRICLEEKSLKKYCVIKQLILLNIQNIIDIKEVLLHWFINFSIYKNFKNCWCCYIIDDIRHITDDLESSFDDSDQSDEE